MVESRHRPDGHSGIEMILAVYVFVDMTCFGQLQQIAMLQI